jgi:hypothetical protein
MRSSTYNRPGGPQSRSKRLEKEKHIFPLLGIEPEIHLSLAEPIKFLIDSSVI